MKTALFALCLLCAPMALGQASVGMGAMNAEPVVTEFYSHDKHASQTPMAQQQSLLLTSDYAFEHGERPLWEVAPPQRQPVSLGEVAREYRKEHALVKKATIVWEK